MRYLGTIGLVGLLACESSTTENVKNVAPEITSLIINPDSGVQTGTELLCLATAIDENEDVLSLSYVWTDSQGVELSNTAELVVNSDATDPNEDLTCTALVSDGIVEVSSSTSITIENTAPEVTEVRISPEVVEVDSLLECSYDASDLDDETLTASFQWTQNGVEVGTEPTLQLNVNDYESDDVIECIVTVEDEHGGTGSNSAVVYVGNTPPVIGTVSIVPEEAYSNDILTCVTNDVVDSEDHDVTLSYEWYVDGVLQSETTDTLSGPLAVNAEILCRVTPNDGRVDGQTVEASVTILNTAPVMNDITITPSTGVEADTLLSCLANSTDADLDNTSLTTTYEWSDVNGNILDTTNSYQLSPSAFAPGDSVNCTATVEDEHGDTDLLSASITIENTAPIVDATAVISGTPGTGETLTCSAVFSDLNDGFLTPSYEWTTSDGTVLSSTDTYTIDSNETNVGDELTCTATATDTNGEVITSSASVTVQNELPTIASVSLTPDPLVSTDDVNCVANGVYDLDMDSVSLSYEWTVDGIVVSETSDMLSGPIAAGSTVDCAVTPNDGFGDGATVSASITVTNTVPVVDSVELDSTEILSDGTVTATATLSDIDATQTVSANYEWFVNGTSVQNGSMDTLDGAFFVKGDDVYVVVTPNDGVEDGTAVQSSSITIGNTAPSNLVVSVTSSDSFYNDSTLTCSATADDFDVTENVDSLTFDYTWSNGSTGDTLVLDSSVAMPGDTLTCSVTATDGDDSITVEDAQVITNRTPVVDSVSLPQSVTATTPSIICSATASDADGETPILSYVWTVDGSVATETSDTLTQTFTSGSVIECSVIANDAMVSGTIVTASTTVMNTAPVVDSVTLDSVEILSDGTVTATAVLSDVDPSNTLTANYEWFVNGTSVQNGSMDTLDGAYFVKGDDVYVVVTPNDGYVDGTAVQSSSISIGNTAPSNLVVSVTSSDSFYNDSTLTCSATADDLDVTENVDSLTFDYIWSNGSTGNTLVLDSSVALPGDTITCSVTATDGTDSISGSDSQGIANRAPVVDSVSLPQSVTATTPSVMCSATASDVDGTTPTLSYAWTVDGNSVAETSDTLTQTFTSGSVIECSVTPNDGYVDGTAVTASTTVMNTAPVVDSVTLDSLEILSDGTVTATATLSDVDPSNTLTANYEWFVNGTSVQNGSTATLDGAFFVKGDDVYVVVTPNDGYIDGTAVQSSSITIGNTAPSNLVVSVTSSDSFYNDSTLTCSATASDLDVTENVDSLSYSYSWSTGDTGSTLTLNSGIASPGDTITCSVVASDGTDTVSGSDSQGITNRTPVVDSVSLPQNVTAATSSVICSASGSDADGEVPTLSYAWVVNGNSVAETSSTLTQTFVAGSTITCSVTPSDATVSGLTLSASTTVANTAPVVDSVTLNSPVLSDGTVTATAVLSDIDSSQTVSATYNWFVNGTSVQNGSSTTLAGSNFVKGDSVYVVVTPNDGIENGTAVQSSSITIGNTAPSNLVVSVTSSDSFYNDSTLTCSATADDLDVTENVDSLSYSYSWSTGATGSTLTLSSGIASPGDTITCSVVASDGTDTVSGSDSQGIANRAPTATASLPSSATAATPSLTCTATGSDPDGTTPTLSYGWSINGNAVVGLSSTLSGPFTYGDTVTCGVTASDGSLTGSATASVGIGNTAPVVNSVTIDSSAYTNDTLTATVSTFDLDNQTVSVNYNWFVNGSTVQNGSTNTLSGATYFDRDDTVYVIVTPNDGVENGSTAQSSTLTISNTAPTAPTVAVTGTSTPPVEQIDDLTCAVTSASTDADSDTITYTYNWYDPNGTNAQSTTTSSLTDTFLASGTTEGLWECEVIASDGSLTATTTADLEVDADWPGLLEFTNCGQTGQNGPSQSQCDSTYNGTTLDSSVTLASGVQQWIVPTSGFYRIVAAGAQGGTGNVSNYPGGDGAIMRGTFYLTAGDTLNIVVGQRGTNGSSSSPAGGGGGTFVYTGSIGGSGLYIAAGGGGGGGEESTANGYDATTAEQGYNYFGSSGTIGYGGTSGTKVTGGAGWYSAGSGTYGGQQWVGGNYSGGYGGFGGGAGGEPSDGGGGGGGYSGAPGHSNSTRSTWGGGGAGSYNSGTAQSNTSGANTSHGYVTIDQDYAESCNDILTMDPSASSGSYEIAPNGTPYEVYCDMSTDGGGWTLVGSSLNATMNDQASSYYSDLATATPSGANGGVWDGLRGLTNDDIRFTCDVSSSSVDLSFYSTASWYDVITTGTDTDSCFHESNGSGQLDTPARKNNINGDTRSAGDQWNQTYLEGEDSCSDTGDFTVDFDDRGMDSNQADGTDWGEDDSTPKCGSVQNGSGYWQIWVR